MLNNVTNIPSSGTHTTIKPTIDNDIDYIISFGGRRESWRLQKDCKHGRKVQKNTDISRYRLYRYRLKKCYRHIPSLWLVQDVEARAKRLGMVVLNRTSIHVDLCCLTFYCVVWPCSWLCYIQKSCTLCRNNCSYSIYVNISVHLHYRPADITLSFSKNS